jgi:hypothetical protein
VTQSIAPIRTARQHRTILVGVGSADSTPTYDLGIWTSPSGCRPDVLHGNEALFPDRRCYAGRGTRD